MKQVTKSNKICLLKLDIKLSYRLQEFKNPIIKYTLKKANPFHPCMSGSISYCSKEKAWIK